MEVDESGLSWPRNVAWNALTLQTDPRVVLLPPTRHVDHLEVALLVTYDNDLDEAERLAAIRSNWSVAFVMADGDRVLAFQSNGSGSLRTLSHTSHFRVEEITEGTVSLSVRNTDLGEWLVPLPVVDISP